MSKELSNAAAERAAAQKALANGDLKSRDEYTAKQVATRCGTDPKTMRKFFRSSHSTIEPVGQGGRYVFAAKDLPKIQKEFKAWTTRNSLNGATRQALTQRIRETKKSSSLSKVAIDSADEDFTAQDVQDAIDAQRAQELAAEPTDEELLEMDDLEMED
jgi:hypothetical protein